MHSRILHNTGVLLNYTGVKSKIKYLNASGAVVAINDLTQLSRKSANATLYYEDSRLSARVSAAYRSGYLTQIPASEAGNDVQGTNSTLNIDASVQYTINRHLKVTLRASTLLTSFRTSMSTAAICCQSITTPEGSICWVSATAIE